MKSVPSWEFKLGEYPDDPKKIGNVLVPDEVYDGLKNRVKKEHEEITRQQFILNANSGFQGFATAAIGRWNK